MAKIEETNPTLPFVVCECGVKLIINPDLDEMLQTIEEHATIHGNKETNPEKAQAEYCRIEEQLSNKVLIALAKRNNN
jgi:hypothetical protein